MVTFIAKGKVRRLAADKNNALISLLNLPPEQTPGGDGNFFALNNEHPYFKELYSLVLMAAVNRYDLEIRIDQDPPGSGQDVDIAGKNRPRIWWMAVNWS